MEMGVGESKWLKRDTKAGPSWPVSRMLPCCPPQSHPDGGPAPSPGPSRRIMDAHQWPHQRHELQAQSAPVENLRVLAPSQPCRGPASASCRLQTGRDRPSHALPAPSRPRLSATAWEAVRNASQGGRKASFRKAHSVLSCPVLFLEPSPCRLQAGGPVAQSPVARPPAHPSLSIPIHSSRVGGS